MDSADSESRIEWFNKCCELQNALGQAEKTVKALEAENAKLKEIIGNVNAKLKEIIGNVDALIAKGTIFTVDDVRQALKGESDGR